ncbi:MAG TPA: hypothetical protein VE974_00675 [Thermoanaerobaculia bacterium]|nr:hypothetical protein [Thermoanaerobaculia bacterium]
MGYVQRLLSSIRLKHLSSATLRWLAEHSDDFRVEAAASRSVLTQIKPLTELMLLLGVLAKYDIRNEHVSRLSDRAIAEANEFDWHRHFSFDASGATILGTVAEFFAANDVEPPFELDFCRFLHTSGYLEGMDRVPYREMDRVHCLAGLISPEYAKELPMWFAGTAFGRRQHYTRYTIDDLYSLTHAAFYLSNFGTRDVAEVLDAETTRRLHNELVELTGVVMRSDNIDVLGEFLICWIFCRVPDTPLNKMLFRQAFERVVSATISSGETVAALRALPRAQAGQTTFNDSYHTTLVAALLFSLAAKETPAYAA